MIGNFDQLIAYAWLLVANLLSAYAYLVYPNIRNRPSKTSERDYNLK
ncbi:MAG: hypothetical protein JWQ25_1046 [Daejeonella sp.]|nr:hypothetical protein [Daejeonella sp.]